MEGSLGWLWSRFLPLVSIWGFSFFFIKVGDSSFAALQVSAGRILLGAAFLAVVSIARRESFPRGWAWWAKCAVAGTLEFAVPFSLFALGEERVSAVLAGVWNATTPLMVMIVASLGLADERISAVRIGGLVTGLMGVLIVLNVWHGLPAGTLLGSLMCLGATACYGVGHPFVRRYLTQESVSLVPLTLAQLLVASAEVALAAGLFTRWPARIDGGAVLSIALLGVLGTGLAGVLRFGIIEVAGPIAASLVTYFIPVISTLAGALLLGESVSWTLVVGGLVILWACAITQDGIRRRLFGGKAAIPAARDA